MKSLNLQRMRKTAFPEIWSKYLFGPYSESDKISAIQLIIFFVSSANDDMKKLGYRLALLYTKHTHDYSIIHAVAAMTGLVPVKKLSEISKANDSSEDSLVFLLRDSFAEVLKDGDIYLTTGQKLLKGEFLAQINNVLSVVAPTSYGKSSLINDYLQATTGNLCVIVPTKSLLAQTRKMLLQNLPMEFINSRKIITHHDMYKDGDQNIIAVLTQERFLRLMQLQKSLIIQHLIVDESHNLFESGGRARELVSSIIIALYRNPRILIKFLSPFIVESKNLENRIYDIKILHLGTKEYVKSELIHYVDFRNNSKNIGIKFIYDQFMNLSYIADAERKNNPYDYIFSNAGNKNIIYLNRPVNTHQVAKNLLSILPIIKSHEIDSACSTLATYLHQDYLLISCIRRGVIFHHGSVPDNIRLYLENLYSSCQDIKYIITTSTLLEGVNLPAYKMFLLDIKKGRRNLSSSQLRNLIGRICRFKEVFTSKDLNALLPEIHFVGCEHYSVKANIKSYLMSNLKEDQLQKDIIENPLLKGSDSSNEKIRTQLDEELNYLGNAEENILEETDYSYKVPHTKIGKLCFLNRIADFDVLGIEEVMDEKVVALKRLGVMASDPRQLIEMINEIYLKNLSENEYGYGKNIFRLRDNVKARDFYSMVLSWRVDGLSYQQMINNFIRYWKSIEDDINRRIVYAGNWGTRNRDNTGFGEYVNIADLSHPERVTLAIARIEAEMTFLDYYIMKYVDCLNELELIDSSFMNRLKFGSDDPLIKELMQAGISHALAKIVTNQEFQKYLLIYPSGAIGLLSDIIGEMSAKKINGILINEAKYHIR